ncbi:hypothetical protein [Nocardia alba]|nr:hypothetical protein [Nocardia alba]
MTDSAEKRAREARIAAYEAELARTYSPELDSLSSRLYAVGQITNTGGGCTAISAVIG